MFEIQLHIICLLVSVMLVFGHQRANYAPFGKGKVTGPPPAMSQPFGGKPQVASSPEFQVGGLAKLIIDARKRAVAKSPVGETPRGQKYCLNVALFVKEERRNEFLECIENNQQGTLSTESDVLQYSWGEDTDERNTFHFHEQYVNRGGFEEHRASPHFKVWEAFATGEPSPFTRAPEVKFFVSRGNDRMRLRLRALKLIMALARFAKGLFLAPWRTDYVKGMERLGYAWFCFFEQFDSQPVTAEGKRRRARMEAKKKGLPVEEEDRPNIMASFLPW